MTLAEFFGVLYKEKTADDYLCVTSIAAGRPLIKFFNLIDQSLFNHVVEQDRLGQVYFGVGLLDRALPDNRRGSKENICALPALWVDIDIEGPGHKKKNLFKTEMAALDVIKNVGLEPSIVVQTGGGLHLYFVFNHLWRLDSPEEQERADRISQGFQAVILREAKLKGAVIDMTGDITRILRCPDTLNKKNRVQCRVLETSTARYDYEQFFKFEQDFPIKVKTSKRPTSRDVVIPSTYSELSPELALILDTDPELGRSFRRGDTDRHASSSEVDLSIASKLAWMGLAPDQVANAVVLSRSIVDSKAAKRPDYVARTVARAYVGVQTPEDMEDEEKTDAKTIASNLTDDERADILKEISRRLMVKVTKIIEYTGTRHTYELHTENGKFDLGTSDGIVSWRTLNSAMIQLEKRTIPGMKTNRWLSTVNLMLQCAELRDTGGSGDDDEWLKNYLVQYCRTATTFAHDAKAEYPTPTSQAQIWVKDNERYIHAASFKAWLKHEIRGEDKLVNYRFAARMRGIGCIPHAMPCRIKTSPTSFQAWMLPRNIWDWGEGEDENRQEEFEHHHRNGRSEAPAELAESSPQTGPGADKEDDDPPF